jgi:metal-responsive CopG/Arc/MetJ family transcriptional regulator
MKRITSRIDETTIAAIDRLATDRAGTRSSLVREALREYILRRERTAREAIDRATYSRHRKRIRMQAAMLVSAQPKQ